MRGLASSLRRAALLGLAAVALGLVAAVPAQAGTPGSRVVASGAVIVAPGEQVSDIVIADGPVAVRGRVTGDVVSLHGKVFIGGRVHGDVVALSKNSVSLGPRARIGGDLVYRGAKPAGSDAAVAGDVHKVNPGKLSSFGFAAAAAIWIAATVSTLVLGLLLLWIAPRAADAAFEAARTSTGPAIGLGFGVLIGLPLVAVVALVTLVGIPLGIGMLLALVPVYAVGYTTSAWLLGRRLVAPPTSRILAFLAGLGILRAAAIVPVLGGLTWLAATVFGLGALTVALWRARQPRAIASGA